MDKDYPVPPGKVATNQLAEYDSSDIQRGLEKARNLRREVYRQCALWDKLLRQHVQMGKLRMNVLLTNEAAEFPVPDYFQPDEVVLKLAPNFENFRRED